MKCFLKVRPLGTFLKLILKSPSIPFAPFPTGKRSQRGMMTVSPPLAKSVRLDARGVRGDFQKIMVQLWYDNADQFLKVLPCFARNPSINFRAMLILPGIRGKLSAVNQPASSISESSREI